MSPGQCPGRFQLADILEYFESAVQIGMTATPLRTDNIDTYNYFGKPLAVYSLRRVSTTASLPPIVFGAC